MAEEIINIHRTENASSLELGTPSKGGAIKVYFDADKLDDAKRKVDNAIMIRQYANEKIGATL